MSKLTVSPFFSLTFFPLPPRRVWNVQQLSWQRAVFFSSFPLSLPQSLFFPFFLFHQGNCEVNFCLSPLPLLPQPRGEIAPASKKAIFLFFFFFLVGGGGGDGRSVVQRKLSNYRKRQFPGRVFSLFRKLIKTIFLFSAFPGGGGRAGVVEMEYYCFFNSETQGSKTDLPPQFPLTDKKKKFSFLILAF